MLLAISYQISMQSTIAAAALRHVDQFSSLNRLHSSVAKRPTATDCPPTIRAVVPEVIRLRRHRPADA